MAEFCEQQPLGCDACPAEASTQPGIDPRQGKKGAYRTGKITKSTSFGKQAPEFTPIPIVFNLCSTVEEGGVTKLFVEEYSGYTGYHIRTIPGRRWRSPRLISAANQLLVVIDRFANYDMVRVTDKYGGAGPGGFDEDGFPLDSVAWESLPDLASRVLPTGYRATGIVAVERSTVLVNLTAEDGNTYVYKWQIESNDPNVQGLISLGEWGNVVGSPTGLFSRPGQQMYFAVSVVQRGSASAVVLYDWLKERLVGFMGLPDGWTPITVGEANNVISVLMTDGSSRYIVRFPFNRETAIMNGAIRGDELPGPSDYPLSKTFQPFDPGFVITDLNLYAQYTEAANKDFARIPEYLLPSGDDSSDLSEGGRTVSGTTQDHNDDREQDFTEYTSSYYGRPLSVRGNIIANPSLSTVLGLSDSFGAVCETLRSDSGGSIDPEQPIFRVVEGKTHSYLSDGGFVYGCSIADGGDNATGVTSGYIPGSVAIDVGYERGRLKDLPDLKVALIDTKTGLYVFQPVKPYTDSNGAPYKLYAGEYAGLEVPEGSTIKDSQCTGAFDDIAELIDGIDRPEHKSPGQDPEPTQFTVDFEDLDAPWSFFKRRAVLGNSPTLSPIVKNYTIREADGVAFLPEHRDPANICDIQYRSKLFWPRVSSNVSAPTAQQSVRSGFFVPNYSQEQTTTHTILQEEIAELEAENSTLQAAIDGGSLSPEQTTQNQSTINANNTRIAEINAEISSTSDDVTFRVPPSVLNTRFTRLEGSKPQTLTNPNETGDFDQSDQIEIPPAQIPPVIPVWSVFPIEGLDTQNQLRPLRRGAVMDTNIRSWVGVDILLERNFQIEDGRSEFRNQAYFANLLGKRVNGNDYTVTPEIGFCTSPAFSYEAGYTAAGGALAVWEIDILANGIPIDYIATRATFSEQIEHLAPEEARSVLLNTFVSTGSIPPFFYRKGKVYFSPEVIDTVTVRVRLVNYAFDVFRVGYRTMHSTTHQAFANGDGTWCPGSDPGFYAGNNCEALCCGNVTCTSFIFFGNKLFGSDPIYPRTRQIVWAGEATYRVQEDPYRSNLNVGMGRVIDAYFEFRLNSTVTGYNIDISRNT